MKFLKYYKDSKEENKLYKIIDIVDFYELHNRRNLEIEKFTSREIELIIKKFRNNATINSSKYSISIYYKKDTISKSIIITKYSDEIFKIVPDFGTQSELDDNRIRYICDGIYGLIECVEYLIHL